MCLQCTPKSSAILLDQAGSGQVWRHSTTILLGIHKEIVCRPSQAPVVVRLVRGLHISVSNLKVVNILVRLHYAGECAVMHICKISATILFSAAMVCAQEIPAGTALPVVLTSTLDARKVKPGQLIAGRIEQDVPLPSGAKIRAGSRLNGRVLQAGLNSDGSSYIRLRFDQLRASGRDAAVTTSLRAVASWWAVQNAELPARSPARAETGSTWTTVQVGDDVVYRGGGHVMHDDAVVGEPVYRGVLAQLISVPAAGCETDSGRRRLALWVFASTACGSYGLDLEIAHAGNTSPMGDIVLESRTNVYVHAGGGMLLIATDGPQPPPTPANKGQM
jgi:hypothetical protein